MYQNIHDFSNLEFNLYTLLNIPPESSCQDATKSFKKIVKKFHPDKITELETKIYENIVLAYQILSDETSKRAYDKWLNKSSLSHDELKDSFKNSDMNQYFPKTKREAMEMYSQQSHELRNRHGNFSNSNDPIDVKFSKLNKTRKNNCSIQRDSCLNEKNFNNEFDKKKMNGMYSDKLIKQTNDIVPYESTSKLNYVKLSDFNKLYSEDSIQTSSFTSLDRAFLLQPVIKTDKNLNSDLSTVETNYSNINYDNLDILN